MSTADFALVFNRLCENSRKNNVEIANSLNVDKATIGRWRSGERTPKLSKLNEIAVLFNVDVQLFASNNHQVDMNSQFATSQDAVEFILRQPMVAQNCGYDLYLMSDEEIIDMVEEVTDMLKIMAKRHSKKR